MLDANKKITSQSIFLRSKEVIKILLDETQIIVNKYEGLPAVDSQAKNEQLELELELEANKAIHDAQLRGYLSIEAAVDHLMLYEKAITEPVETIAIWTCIRGLLESCALALWHLDPNISARERIKRKFAFQYMGLNEQLKFFNSTQDNKKISRVKHRIEEIETQAKFLSIPIVLDKTGKTIGIGQKMLPITNLIESTLNCGSDYRFLSMIAHGNHSALIIGFREIKNEKRHNAYHSMEKNINITSLSYATRLAVTSFSKVFWCLTVFYGWDKEETIFLLEKIYNNLEYKVDYKF